MINYDIPTHTARGIADPETYLHRIGRTGRFGRVGVAVTFVSSQQEWVGCLIQMLILTKIPLGSTERDRKHASHHHRTIGRQRFRFSGGKAKGGHEERKEGEEED